ncbi:MAG: phosphoglycerate kinase [bacterium]|nr:phosphoglycerate kinase [bacterium]
MKFLKDFDLNKKRVLLRGDLNVPIDEETGEILDDFRIRAIVPTLDFLVKNKAKIVLMSHLGRPDGNVVENLKMDKIGKVFSEKLGFKICKVDSYYSEKIEEMSNKLNPGEILLLENLRFWTEEEKNELIFSQNLSKLGDIYINDAFSASHREHSSIVGIAKFFMEKGIGLLFEKELKSINDFMKSEEKPAIFIIGGIKEEKVIFLEKVLEMADFILTSGIVARNLPSALIGNAKIITPVDVVVSSDKGGISVEKFSEIDKKTEIPDIGPETQKLFSDYISTAKKIFWTGSLGKTENDEFSNGTGAIAESVLKNKTANSIIGGGSLLFTLRQLRLRDKGFSHLSTGGGALLDYIVDGKLTGLNALED